jgi:hypothetical protein
MKDTNLRIRQRDPKKFVKLSEIKVDEGTGIYAVVGTMKNNLGALKIQSLIFNTDPSRGNVWTLCEAKKWVNEHKQQIKDSAVSINIGIK